METGRLAGLTPFNRILFFIILVIACFGTLFLAGSLLALPLFGVTTAELPALLSDYDNPAALGLLKYFQLIQSLGLFILPPLLAGLFFEGSSIRYLALNRSPRPGIYLLVVLALFVMTPFLNRMIEWNESMDLPAALASLEEWMKNAEENAAQITEAFLETSSAGGFILNLFLIAVLPAFGEEFLFRGVLQRMLGDWMKNIHLAIFISALAFSAMHLQFYGLLPRFFLGLVFGYMFYWTGSLWIPIFAHFLNNAVAVILEVLIAQGHLQEDAADWGSGNLVMIIASAVLTVIVTAAIRRMTSGTHDHRRTG
jgi:hypothetical protein